MERTLILFAILLTGFTPQIAFAQDGPADAYARAYDFVLEEMWDEAATELENFLGTHGQTRWGDDARYWQCYVMEKKGAAREQVFDCYDAFTKSDRRSSWTDDAKANMIRLGRALMREGNPEYAPIVESLQKDDDEELALSALYALQNIGDEKAMNTIMDLYDRSSNARLRGRIVYILGNFDSPDVVAKLTEIARSEEESSIRKNAVHALGNRDEAEAEAALKTILENNGSREVQKAALHALGNRESEGLVEYLRRFVLGTDDRELGKAATYALGHHESREAVQALSDILENARDLEVKEAALHALGNNEDETTIEILKQVATHGADESLQKAAIYAIANHSGAFPTLRDIFEQATTIEVQKATLFSIGNADSPEIRSFLAETAIGHGDVEVAKAAVYALSNYAEEGDGALLGVFEESDRIEVKKAALYQLSGDVEALVNILDDESSTELRKAAIYALSNADEGDLVPILLDIAQNDSDLGVRKAAISALGNIGTDEAQEALLEILNQE